MKRTRPATPLLPSIARRTFLKQSLAVAGCAGVGAAFGSLLERAGAGEALTVPGYGPLRAANDETTGLALLKLPEGFRYVSFSWTGDAMDGGFSVPSTHDGMGVIASEGSVLTLCRNHELVTWDKPFGSADIRYDPKAGGGCTNLQFDTAAGKWLRAAPALSGTVRNCAGGPTPWGTWLSCEETVASPGERVDGQDPKLDKDHGWVFEVAPQGGSPVPLKAMGRFCHEAVAVDPDTGIVYLTEDRKTAGFYRFTPASKGNLRAGGKLQMLKAIGPLTSARAVSSAKPTTHPGSTSRIRSAPILPARTIRLASSRRARRRTRPRSRDWKAAGTETVSSTSMRRAAAQPNWAKCGSTIRETRRSS